MIGNPYTSLIDNLIDVTVSGSEEDTTIFSTQNGVDNDTFVATHKIGRNNSNLEHSEWQRDCIRRCLQF